MNKNLLALVLFIVFWSTFMVYTGTLTSGYHFTDDHEIIAIDKNVHDNGLVNATVSIVKNDLNIRFRPFYYLHRITLVQLFGTNFLFWSIYNVFLAVITSCFLFLFIYRQGYKLIHALLFPFLTLIGTQSAIWWRLGPNETVGFFLLSASLFFLVNAIFKKKRYQLIISSVFLFLASLSKESFTLFIPAYILMLIWFSYQCDGEKTILKIIHSNIILIICLVLVLLIEIYIIISVVGMNKIGYAGIDNSFNAIKFLKSIYTFLSFNVYSYLILFGLFLLFQNLKSWKDNLHIGLKTLMPYIFNIIILLGIILPQLILYNKSGIFERYLLPLNFGFSLFVIYLLQNVYENNNITLFSKRAFTIAIIYVIYSFLKYDALPSAKIFAKEGNLTEKFISTIIDNTKSSDRILVVLNSSQNYEWGHSINKYLTIKANRKKINFLIIEKQLNNDFEKNLDVRFINTFSDLIVKDINNNFSCIAVLPFSNNISINEKLDRSKLYTRNKFDYFTVYTKNIVDINN